MRRVDRMTETHETRTYLSTDINRAAEQGSSLHSPADDAEEVRGGFDQIVHLCHAACEVLKALRRAPTWQSLVTAIQPGAQNEVNRFRSLAKTQIMAKLCCVGFPSKWKDPTSRRQKRTVHSRKLYTMWRSIKNGYRGKLVYLADVTAVHWSSYKFLCLGFPHSFMEVFLLHQIFFKDHSNHWTFFLNMQTLKFSEIFLTLNFQRVYCYFLSYFL